IQGSATSGGTPIPPRLQVYSAGNHGSVPFNGGEQVGYFALTKQMKNAVIVGNFDLGNNRISLNSSLGPTHDGRLKPDLVAPGTSITSTKPGNAYATSSGTSMASPAVTGIVALVLESYATRFGAGSVPLPSTFRAILVHSAQDITSAVWFTNADAAVRAFPGPDFVTGYGIVNAQRAVSVVTNDRIIESSVDNSCEVETYNFTVPSGWTAPFVTTLAWDDPPANPALALTAPKLVNDLDVVLVDPSGTIHYPWQLNQRIVDGAGNPIPDNLQTCGTPITVQTALQPTLAPNFVGAGDPANVNDPIPPAALQSAGTGRDHLNNLEQVAVPNPPAGTWMARVSGFNVSQLPQQYSLILPVIAAPPTVFRRGLSIHGGVAVPFGILNNTTTTGPTAKLDYVFLVIPPALAADIRLGYSLFPGSGAGDVDIWNLSANVKYAPIQTTPWPFVNAGVGLYYIDSNDLESGFNIGVGIGRRLSQNVDLEVTANYHRTVSASPNVEFAKLQVGLILAL
ncbi:MAG: S8 family serine peptidase, partial [Gemmatimonadales bacterium]